MPQNLWSSLRQGAASGVLAGGFPYAGNIWYVGASAPVFGRRVDTIADAFLAMSPKDILFLGPQRHTEGNLVLPASLSNITIIGGGNRGACFIEPSVAGDEGLQVLASDVTLVNVGVAGGASGNYALNVKGNTTSKNGRRFRAYGCKFEGPTGTVVLLDGDADYNVSDAIFDDCEFAWGGSGLLFDDSSYGYPTQIFVRRCKFHNLTAVGVGLAASGGVTNLELTDCVFDDLEDGTAPTDYIKVDRAGDTGIISGCRFSIATNASADLKIAAGIMWVANGTEAGWSTARPA